MKKQALLIPVLGYGAVCIATTFGVIGCQTDPVQASGERQVWSVREHLDSQDLADEAHMALFVEDRFPTAAQCGRCHPTHFGEWSVSPHAYSQISPVFNAMQGSVGLLTNGANADFCIRCHDPIGMELGEPVFTSNLNRAKVSAEGITCIVCHRVNGDFGKISGRFKVQSGDIHQPVNGPFGGKYLAEILADPDVAGTHRTETDGEGDIPIHGEVNEAFFLTQSGFCGSCHDVTSPGGFRLEEAFSEFKSSPAAKNGVSCQDCHMSVTEGADGGYYEREAAVLRDGSLTPKRKGTSHYFAGPDYSIVHPGIFPILSYSNSQLANMEQWLEFDLDWGTDAFEEKVTRGEISADEFPAPWNEAVNRRRGHGIVYGPNGQLNKLARYQSRQVDVLRAGYQLGDVRVNKVGDKGLSFDIEVKNGTDGHNVPTGFIAERTLFLEVEVVDAEGQRQFISGDTDPNGDVRDLHSIYVHNGALPLDEYLFSLQSKFIVRLVRGGEREQVLAINHSPDPLPFTRPAATPNIATGRPGGARTHRVGLPPLGNRWADYRVNSEDLTGEGPYTVRVRMISGMVPPNLIQEIKNVGFDYGMNPRQIAQRVVDGRPVLWEGEFVLDEEGSREIEWTKPQPNLAEWLNPEHMQK